MPKMAKIAAANEPAAIYIYIYSAAIYIERERKDVFWPPIGVSKKILSAPEQELGIPLFHPSQALVRSLCSEKLSWDSLMKASNPGSPTHKSPQKNLQACSSIKVHHTESERAKGAEKSVIQRSCRAKRCFWRAHFLSSDALEFALMP